VHSIKISEYLHEQYGPNSGQRSTRSCPIRVDIKLVNITKLKIAGFIFKFDFF